MKAIVIKAFRDKGTKKLHMPFDEVEITAERLDEINTSKYGPFVRTLEQPPVDEPETNAQVSSEEPIVAPVEGANVETQEQPPVDEPETLKQSPTEETTPAQPVAPKAPKSAKPPKEDVK